MTGMAMGSWMLIVQAQRGYGPGAPWPVLHTHLLLVGFLLLLMPTRRGPRPPVTDPPHEETP